MPQLFGVSVNSRVEEECIGKILLSTGMRLGAFLAEKDSYITVSPLLESREP